MGGAKRLSAPRLVGSCGGEEFESTSELRVTGSERNRKDDQASRSRRDFQCRTLDGHRCRINVPAVLGAALYRGMKRKTKLQTNAVNRVSLTIISPSSTPIDDSETVIAVAPAVKSVNETIVSAREIIIGEMPIIISGPETLIFIPETIIGGTPAIVSGSEIFISITQILISAA